MSHLRNAKDYSLETFIVAVYENQVLAGPKSGLLGPGSGPESVRESGVFLE